MPKASTQASRNTKKVVKKKSPAKKSRVVVSPSKSSQRKPGLRLKLAFALVVASIGSYYLFTSFADTPATTGIVVGMQDIQGDAVTVAANGKPHHVSQELAFQVLDTNALVCGDTSDPDNVTTTQLTSQQVSDIANRVIAAGISAQPAEVNSPGNAHVGDYTLISVHSGSVQKDVAIYGSAEANDFARSVRAIGKDVCKKATKKVPREEAPKANNADTSASANTKSNGQKIATYIQNQLMAKASASGYYVDHETAVYKRTDANRSAYGRAQLTAAACIRNRARYWDTQMAATNTMYHSSNVFNANNSTSLFAYCGVQSKWDSAAENIGWNSCTTVACATDLIDMMMQEVAPNDGHRVNLLSTGNKYYGVGVYYDSTHGKIWVTQDFLNCFNNNCGISTYTPTYANGPTWRGWKSTGVNISAEGAPAVASPNPGRYDVFQCSGGTVHRNVYKSVGGWSGWGNLGGSCVGNVAATSWGPGRLDVFDVTSTGYMQHIAESNGSWSAWETLPGRFLGSPSASTRGKGTLDIYGVGTNSEMYHRYYGSSGWTSWAAIPGVITNNGTAAVYRSPATYIISIFAVGADNTLQIGGYSSGWAAWTPQAGAIAAAPSADSPDNGHITVAVRNSSNAVAVKNYVSGSGWGGYTTLSGVTATQGPAIGDWDVSRQDIFVRGSDGILWQNSKW